MNALLETALAYARAGLAIFPLHPRLKVPFGKPKPEEGREGHVCVAPLHQHGFKDATIDPAVIEAWWGAHPAANIGMATGRGLDVLDVDGPKGERALAALVARRWPLPETCEVRTGRDGGGRQLHFRSAGWMNTASKIGPQLDTRGLGGFVLLPPSVHPSGAIYSWMNLSKPAGAPGWLTALLVRPESVRRIESRRPIREPSRYAVAALGGAVHTVRSAPEGARNDTLNREAFGIGQLVAAGALDEGYAEDEMVSAALSAGLTETEARGTVRSAFRGGAANPRDIRLTS